MAESLRAKVVIPVHYDIWTNSYADLKEITELWRLRRTGCNMISNHLFGKLGVNSPIQKTKIALNSCNDRGFEDVFTKRK